MKCLPPCCLHSASPLSFSTVDYRVQLTEARSPFILPHLQPCIYMCSVSPSLERAVSFLYGVNILVYQVLSHCSFMTLITVFLQIISLSENYSHQLTDTWELNIRILSIYCFKVEGKEKERKDRKVKCKKGESRKPWKREGWAGGKQNSVVSWVKQGMASSLSQYHSS